MLLRKEFYLVCTYFEWVKVMPYNTWLDVKRICGLEDTVTEDELSTFITKADQAIIEKITVKVRDEVPSGDIDGSNQEFWVANYPIADVNADASVQGYESGVCTQSNADYHVYLWTDSSDVDTKVEVEVDNDKCDPIRGRIYLKTAPPTTYEKITVDYSYYPNEINWEVLKLCAALYAGYLYTLSKYSLYPRKLKLGSLTVDFSGRIGRTGEVPGLPHERLLYEFNRNWHMVYKKPIKKIVREEVKKASVSLAEELLSEGD